MTHVNYNQIDKTVKSNKVYRFTSELSSYENNDNNSPQDLERIENLNTIIEVLNSQKDKKQISDEKMQAHFEILKNSQYQKKWQFLTLTQRLNRLQEFIERTEITDTEHIEKLKRGVNQNILRTKDIKYNLVKGCIEEISTAVLDAPAKEEVSAKKKTTTAPKPTSTQPIKVAVKKIVVEESTEPEIEIEAEPIVTKSVAKPKLTKTVKVTKTQETVNVETKTKKPVAVKKVTNVKEVPEIENKEKPQTIKRVVKTNKK